MIYKHYFTIDQINKLSYFDFQMYMKLLYNLEESIAKQESEMQDEMLSSI